LNKKSIDNSIKKYYFVARMKLLTTANTKIKKGEKLGFMSFGIHLAPAKLSGFNVCKSASAGCAAACLNTAGMGIYSTVQAARIAKTKLFFSDKSAFLTQLAKEIGAAVRKAEKNGMKPCFRLNLTSDLPWENIKLNGQTVFEIFPNVQFYDYTKIKERMFSFLDGSLPANYHLTFSRAENTSPVLIHNILACGGNVAMVFRKSLPARFMRREVVNGDESDVRFIDPKGVIVGLVEKGMAKKDLTGFVLEPN
jgi:hypothetical protein